MNPAIYQMISFLLNYPNVQMKESLQEIKVEIANIAEDGIRENIQDFINELENRSLDDWISHYIEHFDFGRLTNLYVTYLKLGEQRERGLELLRLKKYYEANGFDVTDKELPDYLPLMLEFCAHVPVNRSNELLQMHQKAIVEMQNKLSEQDSFYQLLFAALCSQMEANGLKHIAEEAI